MSDHDSAARPHRKSPVHHTAVEFGNRSIVVFVTVCTKSRAPVLATQEMHRRILDAWIVAGHWLIGRYAILPDHIHLFCSPGVYPIQPLLNWVRYWKSLVAKSIAVGSDALWEKNFWDTQLRRGDSYQAKWGYVMGNPVRHRLVERAEDWPYQGELNVLPWQD
jgi:putative transposase